MGLEDLTKQYSGLFEKRLIYNPFRFLRDVYQSGKMREFSSFLVWEVLHKLHLFPKKEYLRFTPGAAIYIERRKINEPDFVRMVQSFFSDKGIAAVPTPINWKVLFRANDGTLYGSLYPDDSNLYSSTDNGQTVTHVFTFPERIKSLFVTSQQCILVCAKGAVYQSSNHGASFERVLELGSSESFFRHNNAITETPDKTLIMGEYGNVWEHGGWRKIAYLYFSSDQGRTWKRSQYLIDQGTNKHVHIVKYSQMLDRLVVADGDNYKRLWISAPWRTFNIDQPVWKNVTRFHIQMGGYTSVIEGDGKLLFGTDYQGGTNFLVATRDGVKYTKQIVPDPYRRSPIDNMVQRRSARGIEIWANLPYSTAKSRCLLMYSADGGASWTRLFEYNRATHTIWLISAANEPTDDLYLSIEAADRSDRMVFRISDSH